MPDLQIIPHKIGIVVVGANHNPSILNPDFLRHQCIVPEAMTLVGPVISTPAFSQVVYQGLEIVSEPNRISFTEDIHQQSGHHLPQRCQGAIWESSHLSTTPPWASI